MDFLNKLTHPDQPSTGSGSAGSNTVARPGDNDHVQTSGAGGGLFDKLGDALGGDHKATVAKEEDHKTASGGGFFGKINEAMGGGAKGEAKEDGLDKAVDWVQEHVMKQGPQNNESAIEQAKDEQISDAIRSAYKSTTGHEFFIKDKQ